MTTRLLWKDDLGRETINRIVKKVIPGWTDGLRPVQMDLVVAILDGDDVLCCTATGDGKSAAFSVPLLVLQEYNAHPELYPRGLRTRVGAVGIVVTPTKGLANNIKLGISAFAYCKESLAEARQSGINITEEIKACTWQVVCVDPEHLGGKEWRNISESEKFRVRLLYFSVDEAHLINEWGADFRPDFRMIGLFFRGRLARSTSLPALSATLAPGPPTASVCMSLGLFEGQFHLIRHTNERPNFQFIMKTLTHGLAGYDFPDLLPFLNSGRKVVIHCATIELVFRVYVYIWRHLPDNVDKLRRVRAYHSLGSLEYNEHTIWMIDNDPYCQIIIATIAFSNGINARTILDSITLGIVKTKTLDEIWQEKGRAGREAGSIARGVVLVQLSSITAAMKQLNGWWRFIHRISAHLTPIGSVLPPQVRSKRGKGTQPKQSPPPMETALAQLLIEKCCYYALINKHYGNPPLDKTSLDCSAADRPMPCSLCQIRSKKILAFTPPPSAIALPPLIPQLPTQTPSVPSADKKLKLTSKERKSASATLKKFRNTLRAQEQLAGIPSRQMSLVFDSLRPSFNACHMAASRRPHEFII
ncbi:P-loop containing nucleoside triphosphate hydrolase protein [Mycena sanguinolenta]|nr:P-loop containing nucleoside triphosphate hydrolase protein [Mycena sanguinolenta]